MTAGYQPRHARPAPASPPPDRHLLARVLGALKAWQPAPSAQDDAARQFAAGLAAEHLGRPL